MSLIMYIPPDNHRNELPLADIENMRANAVIQEQQQPKQNIHNPILLLWVINLIMFKKFLPRPYANMLKSPT